MKFYSLYVEIDNKFFNNKKSYNSIKEISICEYNSGISFTKSYKVGESSKTKNNYPYFHEIWQEIEPMLFNQTVLMFDGNFITTTIFKTFEYLSKKTISKESTALLFPELETKMKNVRFDYICLSLVIRRLFNDLPYNTLPEICSEMGLNCTSAEEAAQAICNLTVQILEITKSDNFIDLKHNSGITMGQIMRNEFTNITIPGDDPKNKFNDKVIGYEKYHKFYYPCLPITEDERYRIYDFNELKNKN